MIGLQFLDQVGQVSQAVADEFEQFVAGLKGYLEVEHKDDGTHGDITADSIVAGAATIGTAVIESATIGSIVVTAGTLAGTFTGNMNVAALKFTPTNTWAVASGDTELLLSTNGPLETLWYLTRAGSDTSVYGITANLVTGNPGQLVVLMNTSAFTLSFESAVVTNARRLYGCTVPVRVPPGGMITFVYDVSGSNKGWRYLASSQPYYDYLDQAVKIASSPTFANLKVSGAVQLADLAGGQFLNLFAGSDLSANRDLIFTTGDASRTITLLGNPTLGDWLDQSVKIAASPTFNGLTLTSLSLGGFALTLTAATALNQNLRTSDSPAFAGLTLASFALTLTAAAALNQNLRTTDSPTFSGVTVTNGLQADTLDATSDIDTPAYFVSGTAGVSGDFTLALDGGGSVRLKIVKGIATIYT